MDASHDHLIRTRISVDSLQALEIYGATRKHHAEVEKVLDRHRGTTLTDVDASRLVSIAQQRSATIRATDQHPALSGADVLPHG